MQNKQEIEELEQYGRRLCLRFEGIPTEKNETSDKVLDNIMGICERSEHTGLVYRMLARQLKNDVRASLFGFQLFATGQ